MHLLSLSDLSADEVFKVLESALEMKNQRKKGRRGKGLEGKSLAMVFEKPSTRTRVSFEVAIRELGGYPLFLSSADLQLGRGEPISDTSLVLSRYVDGIMARTYSHNTLSELAKHARVPIINGLSDLEHPCQSLADLLTIYEYDKDLSNLTLTWVGDGNNVCNSTIFACALTGMKMNLSCPGEYMPNKDIINKGKKLGLKIEVFNDPIDAVATADIIYTDTWVSMGDEDDEKQRLEIFSPYQVNQELVEASTDDVKVMHCLPAHYGQEITRDVALGNNSIIFDQAENRLHAQKAVLLKLMGN